MADRLFDLKQTPSAFELRGIVTGTQSKRFYRAGIGKTGGSWNSIEFGVKITENKTVYVKLNGFPRKEVYYYKRGENGAKGITQSVAWKDRKKSPGNGYRLIGVNISTGRDENGRNINESLTEYDCVEWLHENLKDGESVFIRGNLEFSSYTDRNGQIRKKMDMVPTQISYTQKPIDFDAEDYKETAEFENTLVFSGIEKEMDENDKPTGRFVLSGYSIGYNTVESVSFIIGADNAKLAGNLKKAMKPGYSIKTYGRVEVINNISAASEEDDGWGSASPMERINSPVRRENIVYRADPNTIEKEDYTEESIAAAIRKIKANKKAETDYGESPSVTGTDDWGNNDENDEEDPW